jgi:hypothetical protein
MRDLVAHAANQVQLAKRDTSPFCQTGKSISVRLNVGLQPMPTSNDLLAQFRF